MDRTHIYQILPSSLSERVFASAAASKESDLAEEKKKVYWNEEGIFFSSVFFAQLEEQLREMQERNAQLSAKLSEMDREVKEQALQAQSLLSDVQEAKFTTLDPSAMLELLRQQLVTLVQVGITKINHFWLIDCFVWQSQSATAEQLENAKTVNEQLFQMAKETAERREKVRTGYKSAFVKLFLHRLLRKRLIWREWSCRNASKSTSSSRRNSRRKKKVLEFDYRNDFF